MVLKMEDEGRKTRNVGGLKKLQKARKEPLRNSTNPPERIAALLTP